MTLTCAPAAAGHVIIASPTTRVVEASRRSGFIISSTPLFPVGATDGPFYAEAFLCYEILTQLFLR
jgi:hypothetical protein